jgi:hypothetical protein
MPPKDIDPDIKPPIDPEYPHRYFVTYTYRLAAIGFNFGFGSFAIGLRLPIRGADDVLYVSGQIRESNPTFTDIVIIGWQKFEE